MRILMVARRYPPDVRSGTETVFENLYTQARKAHEVRLVVGYRQARDMVPAEAVAVDLRKGTGWLKMAHAARKAAADFKPDVVLSNSIEVQVPGVPCATIVHDLNFGRAGRSLGTIARERFYALQARGLEAVIAVSAATRDDLVRIGVDKAKIHVVQNGVDVDRFVPRPAPPSDKVRFVYPSRILPGKAQHAAIDALGRMRPDQRKHVHLTIVGALADRIYYDQLKVQAYNLPVTFATDVADIVPYYQDADVVLFPTLMTEGFGFTAVEGMACGKPVIFYDQPAVREATGGVAIGVPRDDAHALRDAMLRLIADPAERARLGAAGRAYVESRYRWSTVWGQYQTILSEIR